MTTETVILTAREFNAPQFFAYELISQAKKLREKLKTRGFRFIYSKEEAVSISLVTENFRKECNLIADAAWREHASIEFYRTQGKDLALKIVQIEGVTGKK